MSIYIQGMKMPKKPGEPITVTIFRTGSVWSPHVDLSEARAIELPPHGDLIDREKIPFVEAEYACDDYAFRYDINEMTPVIPAEGGADR